jgi:thiol:disulfide interchange protein DsbD
LALAFKFLSNADLVLQLHLLEREVFFGNLVAIFWYVSVLFFGKSVYLMMSPLTHISVGRLIMGLCTNFYYLYDSWTLGAPLKS